MAGITLQQAENHLRAWLDAELKLTTHQSYTFGTRTLTKADLGEVRRQITYWQNICKRLSNIKKHGSRNRLQQFLLRDL